MEVGKVFLETNTYSNYSRGDKKVGKIVFDAREVFISVVTLGELWLGFIEGSRRDKNEELLKKFLSDFKVSIVNVDAGTSWRYGKIKYVLRRNGTPIPDNDIWIAAGVVETGATLVTYDKHFLKIPGLKVWKELE